VLEPYDILLAHDRINFAFHQLLDGVATVATIAIQLW
jgi:hypothetical protein